MERKKVQSVIGTLAIIGSGYFGVQHCSCRLLGVQCAGSQSRELQTFRELVSTSLIMPRAVDTRDILKKNLSKAPTLFFFFLAFLIPVSGVYYTVIKTIHTSPGAHHDKGTLKAPTLKSHRLLQWQKGKGICRHQLALSKAVLRTTQRFPSNVVPLLFHVM